MDKQDDEFELFLKTFRLRQPHRQPTFDVPSRRPSVLGLVAAAALVVVSIVLPVLLLQHPFLRSKPDESPSLAAPQLEPRKIFRSAYDGTVVSLEDGSEVEMRSDSELMLELGVDGININLTRGRIIVTAAKQRDGHLHVITKAATVSVVGTVFVVDVEDAGSRVTVIQGEVRVEHGAGAKNLIAGQQVATNPWVPQLTAIEEISWSRHAQEYAAILRQLTAAVQQRASAPVQTRPEFSAVSIKPVSRDDRPRRSGLSCHGSDGIVRALFGGIDPVIAPQGRCVGERVRLTSLIALAYGVPVEYVSGGPDWTRFSRDEFGTFQIEAVAENSSTATLSELRRMLQATLTDRFKHKVRKVVRPVHGYSLVVAKNGPKLKQTTENEESPFPVAGEKGGLTLKGKSTISQLIPFLTQALSSREITPVIDKTGLTDRYDYEIVLMSPGGGQRGLPRDSDLSDLLESQVGLQLRPEKSVPVEMIVIDEVAQPTPN
jgi:uncharacterized protein (TIGR03435 family)